MNKMFAAILTAISLLTAVPALADSAQSTQATEQAILYVDINNDSAEKMADLLKGIGMKKANAIVSYREDNGPFTSAEDLVNVSGIGASTFEKNRAAIVIGESGN